MRQLTHAVRSKQLSLVARCCLLALFILVAILLSTSKSRAQDRIAIGSLQKDSTAGIWHPLKTSGSVTVSYQYVDCGPLEMIQFRISNTSSDRQTVSWKYRVFQNGTEKTQNPDDAAVKLTVDANASLKGACFAENSKLSVLVRESGLMALVTDIELTELLVTIAQ
ncbi:hypothetical protein [Sediminibacterium soli]|uniref:hypothetical protein n=1 Tax=Sediminibacterium soli TaxID=2698829 RepID=UPI00137B3E78|nr:hypothetical protein [Sediminibacterium soli]NCI46522.1 hypothetical protein [Sediminibacterium soli]